MFLLVLFVLSGLVQMSVIRRVSAHMLSVRDKKVATEEQIRGIFVEVIADLQKTDPTVKSDVYVTIPSKKDGERFGFSYVYFSNSAVINAILGKNFDGSKRELVETIVHDDDDELPPVPELGVGGTLPPPSWADEVEQEEAKIERKVTPLPPLVTHIPEFTLTAEQKAKLSAFEDDIGDTYPLEIAECLLNAVEASCVPNMLTAIRTPGWVTAEQVASAFDFLITSTAGGRYPQVWFSGEGKDRVTVVEFDPACDDTREAYLMNRRITVGGNASQNARGSHTMIFEAPHKASCPKRPVGSNGQTSQKGSYAPRVASPRAADAAVASVPRGGYAGSNGRGGSSSSSRENVSIARVPSPKGPALNHSGSSFGSRGGSPRSASSHSNSARSSPLK